MRLEKDALGHLEVPQDALYGIQSVRASRNFTVTQNLVHDTLIESLAQVKKAAAIANVKVAALDGEMGALIVKACDEIKDGLHRREFITPAIQGGAGTSVNMNMNEVIANRVAQLKGEALGSYTYCHPNDHVNKAQSTNDVIPTAGKIATLKLSEALIKEVKKAIQEFDRLHIETKHILKVGRTHLQDAVMISMGEVLGSFGTLFKRDLKRLETSLEELKTINMGATAVGTGINTHPEYKRHVVEALNQESNDTFYIADDLIDGTKHIDSFSYVHSTLKTMAVNLSKMSNDFRLMASGPRAGFYELYLPEKQPGSSIMPGKVNPVIVEMLNQVSFQVIGNDTTINMATEAGQMELNVFEPVLFANLFESIELLTKGFKHLVNDVLVDLKVNEVRCDDLVEHSLAHATKLLKELPYEVVSDVSKKALKEGKSLREVLLDDKILSEQEIETLLK